MSSILMALQLKLKRKKWELHLNICCFMLVPGMANHTPRNWSYWYSTDWYWEDIGILDAWIHSLDFTTNVRTAHRSDLFSCAYFPLHLLPPALNSWDYFLVMKIKVMYWKKNYKSDGISTKFVTIDSVSSSVQRKFRMVWNCLVSSMMDFAHTYIPTF